MLPFLFDFCGRPVYAAGRRIAVERNVRITSGGSDVRMNSFVTQLVRNVLLGIVRSLDDVKPDEEIVITLEADSSKRPHTKLR